MEARICELAGHLTAATCQFLLLIADFDERRGWADWEMPSCAAWLSWKLTWSPAGDLDYQFRAILPDEAATVVFQALRAARNDLEHPHDDQHHGDGNAKQLIDLGRFMVKFRAETWARHARDRQPNNRQPHGDGEHDHTGGGDRDVSAETRLGQISRGDSAAGTSFTGAEPPPAEMEPAENLADALVPTDSPDH